MPNIKYKSTTVKAIMRFVWVGL